MENHNFLWVNQLFLWPFSIAFVYVYQAGYVIRLANGIRKVHLGSLKNPKWAVPLAKVHHSSHLRTVCSFKDLWLFFVFS